MTVRNVPASVRPFAVLRFAAATVLWAGCGGTKSSNASPRPTATQSNAPKVSMSGHDWTRFGVDEARSNASDAPTGITAASLAGMRRLEVNIDGTVDASAIYLHAVQVRGALHDALFVTTSYGKTLALDANDGTTLWRFTPAGYAQWAGSSRITNSTPVADPARDAIYAASPDGHVQKLAVADGHVIWTTAVTLLPQREKIASALNYSRGHVIVATGGYVGDAPPYQGHIVLLDAATGKMVRTWLSLCSDRSAAGLLAPERCDESGSAIWARAGVVVDPASGNLFVATGNGSWDGRTNWGDAVVELDPGADHIIANYTPANTAELDATDADLGSSAPALLDSSHIVQGGKDGVLRLLDLKGIAGDAPHRGDAGEVQQVETPASDRLFSQPAVLRRNGDVMVFVADGGGTAAYAYRGAHLVRSWSNSNAGTSPVVSGGLLYVYDPAGGLYVYQPENGRQLARLACGSGHWNSPIVVDGRIVLPLGSANSHRITGVLDVWRAS